jgi:RNA polymerase sigma factor (sigma-70 family)
MDLSDLYAEHAERMVVFFARRCVDPEIAVDLTAETFAQALKNERQYRGASDEEALGWLFGIARHQLVTYFRRGKAERKALRKLGISLPPLEADDVARIEELADLRQIRAILREQVAHLSTEQREALRLRVIEELSYADVARRLEVSEDAARARVSRGLRQLAASVELSVLWKGAPSNE